MNISQVLHLLSHNRNPLGPNLNVLERCITECKVEDPQIQKEVASTSLRFAIAAAKKKNHQLVSIYTCFIKGWVKLQPTISQDITSHLFSFGDISTRLNIDLHIYLFNKGVLNVNEYEDYLSDYLESPITRNQCIELLNGLNNAKIYNEEQFKKILPFMFDSKLNSLYLHSLFAECL